MRKYAFTLIELLAVIIILAVILVIAVPQVLDMIESTKTNVYKLNIELMKRATETYVESGKKEIVGTSAVITLDELVDNGFINPIKDPADKSTECTGYVVVETVDGETTYTPCLKCGDNYVSEDYDPILAGEEEPPPINKNVHETAVPSGYTGIYTIEDLNNVRNNLSGSYILMNNLDFNSDNSYASAANKPTYTTGIGWNPIGNSSSYFSGTFNGNNFTISNLYINRPTTDYVGLFGRTDSSATTIEKIGLENVNISGKTNVGGLVGSNNYAKIKNSYTTGTVTGANQYVGGLVGTSGGWSGSFSRIDNSYSTATVTGVNYVGGLVGYLAAADAYNSYGTGNVTATLASGNIYAGTFSGNGCSGSNNYRSSTATVTMASGTPSTCGTSTPLSILTTQIYTKYKLTWDIDNIWYAVDKQYPKLGGTTGNQITIQTNITKIEDLYLIRFNLGGTYTLMNDLDFNNASDYRDSTFKDFFTINLGWDPIGVNYNEFIGTFNGNNHVIKNLYINRPNTDYVGLFGTTDGSSTTIEKIGLENVNITGKTYVGGLVGYNDYAKIKNCYVTGTVIGVNQYVGGLVGTSGGWSGSFSRIDNSYSTATVTGVNYVGGLVGYLAAADAYNSYGTGNVTATLASGNIYAGTFSGNGCSGSNNYRSSNATVTMASGTPNTCGTSTSLSILKTQLYTKYQLGWDINNIWYAVDKQYPKLGGATGNQITIQTNITKIEDLYLIRFNLGGTYTLMNDLDFNNASDYRDPTFKDLFTTNSGWIPIGVNYDEFDGLFNGNNHVIKNLYINRPNTDYVGLFGKTYSSLIIIEKLGLENVNITGKTNVGGLVGYNDYANIKNCYTTGTVTGTNQYVGGLIGISSGWVSSYSRIDNSYSTATVAGLNNVGGVIGHLAMANAYNSYGTGNVTATQASGSVYAGTFSGNGCSGSNNYRSSNATVTMVLGTPNTCGTSTSSANLQALNQTGLSTWDTSTIWKVNTGAYPTLR